MPKTILVYADGLGFHYFRNRAIDVAMKEVFPKKIPLRSILSYSVGIGPSIWTSSYPCDHDNWTIWSLREDHQPKSIRINSLQWKLACIVLYGIKRLSFVAGKYSTISASVPNSIRENFVNRNLDMSQPYMPADRQSLFSVFGKERISWYYKYCWSLEDMLSENVQDCDVLVFFAGELDDLGHFQGPESSKVFSRILDLMRILKKLARKTELLCLFSDHGMFPLKGTVDLLSILKNLPLTLGSDYLVFLESTMARFWFFSFEAKARISCLLSDVAFGHFLSQDEIQKYGLGTGGNIFGDGIFLVEPGLEIFPSFFHPLHRRFYKGMHGYAPDSANAYAVFAATRDFKSDLGNLVDISPTVLDLMHLTIPSDWRGRSLVD